MAYTNNNGQARVGVRIVPQVNASSLWNSIYSVYNADATGSSSLKTSLFAAYNFDNNLNDAVGSKNGTGYGGINYGGTSGLINTSIGFNGANAYVNLPNNTGQFNFTDDFSISLWIKPSTTVGFPFLINNYINIGSNNYGYYLYITSTGLRLGIWNGASSAITEINQLPPSNVWSHIVITRKKSTITKIYINGVLTTPTSSTNPTLDATYQPNTIMTLGASFGDYKYSGWMDSLNFWTKELSASEVSELYNSGNGAQYIGDNFYKPTTNDALLVNNGTAQGGLTYGLGKVGTAFQFNGTNAYVSLPDNSLNFTSKFSYSFWSKSNNTTDYGVVVGNLQSSRSPFGFFHGYEVSLESGKVYFYFRSGTNIQIYHYSTNVVNNGNWNHIVVTYDPTNTTTGAKIYVNGTLNVQGATLGVPIGYTSPMKACIGARNHSGSPVNLLPNGTSIDALNVWNKELTASEITELYNSGNGKQYPN